MVRGEKLSLWKISCQSENGSMVGATAKRSFDWWITHFKDMRDRGLYCDANAVHEECLLFCYMAIIREELQEWLDCIGFDLNKEQQFSPWSTLSLVLSS